MILQCLGVGLVAVVLYARAKSRKTVRISRSMRIQAPPEKLFPYLNQPRLIQEWNPFSEGDASLKLVYTGPDGGVGAQWTWEGKKAGAGHATIIESEVNRRVALRLDFKRPFKATNDGEYSLKPVGYATEVTWTIDESALAPRVINVFLSLDKLVGSQFEKGLLKLKALAEMK